MLPAASLSPVSRFLPLARATLLGELETGDTLQGREIGLVSDSPARSRCCPTFEIACLSFGREAADCQQPFESRRRSVALTRANLGVRESGEVVLAWFGSRKLAQIRQHGFTITQFLRQHRFPSYDFRLALRSLGQSRKRFQCLSCLTRHFVDKTEAVEKPHA